MLRGRILVGHAVHNDLKVQPRCLPAALLQGVGSVSDQRPVLRSVWALPGRGHSFPPG